MLRDKLHRYEVPVEKYTADQNGYDFTNKHVPYTRTAGRDQELKNDTVAKPASITAGLKVDGNEVETKNASPDSDGKWTVDFENLPSTRTARKSNTRSPEERFRSTMLSTLGNMDDGMVITNTQINDPCP